MKKIKAPKLAFKTSTIRLLSTTEVGRAHGGAPREPKLSSCIGPIGLPDLGWVVCPDAGPIV